VIDTLRQQYIRKAILRGRDEVETIRLINMEQMEYGIVMGTVKDESEDLVECGWAKEEGD